MNNQDNIELANTVAGYLEVGTSRETIKEYLLAAKTPAAYSIYKDMLKEEQLQHLASQSRRSSQRSIKIMEKVIAVILAFLAVGGCYTCSQYRFATGTVAGQVKGVNEEHVLWCGGLKTTSVSVSLGVIHNGTGSMSTEDAALVIDKPEHLIPIKQALVSGNLVEFTYSAQVAALCNFRYHVTGVKVIE